MGGRNESVRAGPRPGPTGAPSRWKELRSGPRRVPPADPSHATRRSRHGPTRTPSRVPLRVVVSVHTVVPSVRAPATDATGPTHR